MSDDREYIRRRRVPRRSFDRNVGLLIQGQFIISQGLQIGEGGMLIFSPIDLKEGQKIVLSFKLPGYELIVAMGTVRYLLPVDSKNPVQRYGVQFDGIDFNVKRQIRNFVASKEAGPSKPTSSIQQTN